MAVKKPRPLYATDELVRALHHVMTTDYIDTKLDPVWKGYYPSHSCDFWWTVTMRINLDRMGRKEAPVRNSPRAACLCVRRDWRNVYEGLAALFAQDAVFYVRTKSTSDWRLPQSRA